MDQHLFKAKGFRSCEYFETLTDFVDFLSS